MEDEEYQRMFEEEATHWWYVSLHELILRSLPQRRPLVLLDAGCGTGRLLELLSPFGAAEGCDASHRALAFCRERGLKNVFPADLNTAELPPGRYDVITSIDVLYHRAVRDDQALLRKFHDALKPGGLLVLQVPAYAWLRSSHDDAVHTARRYRRSAVIRMLREAGLVCEKATYRVSLLFPAIAAVRLLRGLLDQGGRARPSDVKRHSPGVNAFLLLLMRIENRVLERLSLPFGTSVFVVARKPEVPGPGADRS